MILQEPRQSDSTTDDGWSPVSRRAPLSSDSQTGPVTRLIDEFAAAWRRGERQPAEAFLEANPRLASQPDAAIRLIYEEVSLRRGEGQEVTLLELLRRFPQWQTQLEVLLDCDRLLTGVLGPPAFPMVGETLGGFLLLAELGRGARSRCFLAAQPSLSHRHVVLKVTADDLIEHLSLARLQHTHIMPLYSEHEFPARRLRALCMPYLGGATLSRIMAELAPLPPEQVCGQSLLDVLDQEQHLNPWPQAATSPPRRFLAQASHVRVDLLYRRLPRRCAPVRPRSGLGAHGRQTVQYHLDGRRPTHAA